MKSRMALLLASALLAGCASQTWYRPGTTTAELTEAMTTCRSTAQIASVEIQPTLSGEARLILPDREFDGVVFDRCMRDRGYVRTVTY